MILELLLGPLLLYTLWSLYSLQSNIRKARTMGVPIIIIPVDSMNLAWTITQPWVWALLDRLPFEWTSHPDWVRFSRRGYHFPEKANVHVRLGPVFALVTPGDIYLRVADPEAARDMFSRRRDFLRPTKEYEILRVFGPSISAAGSDDWMRHRKALAPPFNESVMSFVWGESLHQTRAMLDSWGRAAETGIASIEKDIRTLTLNVLASIGLRKSYPFQGSSDPPPPPSDGNNYRDSLKTLLDNVILTLVIPYRYLMLPFMPASWQKVGHAGHAFETIVQTMVEEETETIRKGNPGSGGLVTSFVKSLETHKREEEEEEQEAGSTPLHNKKGLSLSEILGNFFVISFAGHDTTANALAFSLLQLVAHPEIQDWASEEIITLTGGAPPESWEYQSLYPRLKRCRAILLETLRMFPPVMLIPKFVRQPQAIKVAGREVVIPAETRTVIAVNALQCHPEYWAEPDAWNPKRWVLNPAPEGLPSVEQIEGESLYVPERTIFIPFSDGPQNCLGRKLAEVEFTVVMAYLLGSHRLVAKSEPGESTEAVRKRVEGVMGDLDTEILLKMRDPDQVKLVCRKV